MAGLFRAPKMPQLIQQEPVQIDDPDVKEAARLEAARIRKRKGVASTILTGPQGLEGTPDLLKATLG